MEIPAISLSDLDEETKADLDRLVVDELKEEEEEEPIILADNNHIDMDLQFHRMNEFRYRGKAYIKCPCGVDFESRVHWVCDCRSYGPDILSEVPTLAKDLAGAGPLGKKVEMTAKILVDLIRDEKDTEKKAKLCTGFIPLRKFSHYKMPKPDSRKKNQGKKIRKYIFSAFMQLILKRWSSRCSFFSEKTKELLDEKRREWFIRRSRLHITR